MDLFVVYTATAYTLPGVFFIAGQQTKPTHTAHTTHTTHMHNVQHTQSTGKK